MTSDHLKFMRNETIRLFSSVFSSRSLSLFRFPIEEALPFAIHNFVQSAFCHSWFSFGLWLRLLFNSCLDVCCVYVHVCTVCIGDRETYSHWRLDSIERTRQATAANIIFYMRNSLWSVFQLKGKTSCMTKIERFELKWSTDNRKRIDIASKYTAVYPFVSEEDVTFICIRCLSACHFIPSSRSWCSDHVT